MLTLILHYNGVHSRQKFVGLMVNMIIAVKNVKVQSFFFQSSFHYGQLPQHFDHYHHHHHHHSILIAINGCQRRNLLIFRAFISLLANVELEPPAFAGGLFWPQKRPPWQNGARRPRRLHFPTASLIYISP